MGCDEWMSFNPARLKNPSMLGLLDKTERGVSVSCEAQRTKSNQITDSGPVVALPVPGLQIYLDDEGSTQ